MESDNKGGLTNSPIKKVSQSSFIKTNNEIDNSNSKSLTNYNSNASTLRPHVKSSTNITNSVSNTTNKPRRSKTIKTEKQKKKQVSFHEKGFIEVVFVESFKKWNAENTQTDPHQGEKTRCTCVIF
jgi:hypothetical protein